MYYVCPYKIHMLPHWTWTMATFSTFCSSHSEKKRRNVAEGCAEDGNKGILVTLLSLLIEFYLLLVFIIIIIVVAVAAAVTAAAASSTATILVVVVVLLLRFFCISSESCKRERGHRRRGKTWRLPLKWMPIFFHSVQQIYSMCKYYFYTKYEVVFLVRVHTVQTTLSDHFGRRETERPFIQSN